MSPGSTPGGFTLSGWATSGCLAPSAPRLPFRWRGVFLCNKLRYSSAMSKTISKVVIFRAGSLGDNLMGKFFLENVHAAYPSAKCCVVVGERGGMIRGLLSNYPWIEVREVNRRNPASVFRLIRDYFQADLVYT